MSENRDDDFGRYSDAEAARLLVQLTGRRAELRWSVDLVKLRLEEAAKGCERLVGRVGPKGIAAGAWIDYELYGAPETFDQNSKWEGAREGTRGPDWRAMARGGASEIEISRIEQALRWPAIYLAAPKHDDNRKALQIWLWCCARVESFSEYYKALGCSRQSAYARMDRAARTILEGVIRDGVLP